ncbi:MAG: HIT family protein [Nanoarchaeota archaeon]
MEDLPPEVKQQLEEQKKNCVFCKILTGEIPAQKVYEDKEMAAILDINPCTKGHVLLMPCEHYPIMPLIPAGTFKHMFGLMPRFIKLLKDALLTTGANIVIANGGVAGQQAPHFMMHIIPREKGDWLDKYAFNEKKQINQESQDQAIQILANNLPQMMKNHFSRQPPQWEKSGEGEHANWVRSNNGVFYEDEKALAVIPGNPQQVGHVVIYSKEEKSHIENLGFEESSHLFYVASFAATCVFEGLKAHGTNIILKTGVSDDNPTPMLELHVLPRNPDDGLELLNQPMNEKPDMDEVAAGIKDKMFFLQHEVSGEKKEEKIKVNLDEEPETVGQESGVSDTNDEPENEIKNAIKSLKNQ